MAVRRVAKISFEGDKMLKASWGRCGRGVSSTENFEPIFMVGLRFGAFLYAVEQSLSLWPVLWNVYTYWRYAEIVSNSQGVLRLDTRLTAVGDKGGYTVHKTWLLFAIPSRTYIDRVQLCATQFLWSVNLVLHLITTAGLLAQQAQLFI